MLSIVGDGKDNIRPFPLRYCRKNLHRRIGVTKPRLHPQHGNLESGSQEQLLLNILSGNFSSLKPQHWLVNTAEKQRSIPLRNRMYCLTRKATTYERTQASTVLSRPSGST